MTFPWRGTIQGLINQLFDKMEIFQTKKLESYLSKKNDFSLNCVIIKVMRSIETIIIFFDSFRLTSE